MTLNMKKAQVWKSCEQQGGKCHPAKLSADKQSRQCLKCWKWWPVDTD